MSRAKFTAALLALSSVGAMAADARADGAVIAADALPKQTRATLVAEIANAKTRRPAAFARVASLRLKLAELDRDKRGRLAPISPVLKAMGGDALMPMLEEIALDAEPRGALPATAWSAWRIGLLEAIGTLRDGRAAPVLEAIIADALQSDTPADFMVTRAAAQALAKLNSDGVAASLVAASQNAAGDTQRAIVAGMGHCRRVVVVERLAALLAGLRPGSAHADVALLARALGDAGNAWAWETPVVQSSGEGAAVRGRAAEALVAAYRLHAHPEVRRALREAILVVDAPGTDALIEGAKVGADAATVSALDALALALDASPLHR
jgi:hypothetical protein